MKAYRTMMTIKDPAKLVLSHIPFKSGQRVEIVVLETEAQKTNTQDLRRLFKETQSLPHIKKIKEEDILKEVVAYRSRK